LVTDGKSCCGNVENISMDSFLRERMLKYRGQWWCNVPPGVTDFFCLKTTDMIAFCSKYHFLWWAVILPADTFAELRIDYFSLEIKRTDAGTSGLNQLLCLNASELTLMQNAVGLKFINSPLAINHFASIQPWHPDMDIAGPGADWRHNFLR